MVRLRDSWPFNLSSAPTVGNPCRPLQPESVSHMMHHRPLTSGVGNGVAGASDEHKGKRGRRLAPADRLQALKLAHPLACPNPKSRFVFIQKPLNQCGIEPTLG